MKKFLIILTGQGDLEIKLCAPETEAWLDLPARGNEVVPPEVAAGDPDYNPGERINVYVSLGSADNDRAIAAPGIRNFESFAELLAFIKTNDVELTGEFVGQIY